MKNYKDVTSEVSFGNIDEDSIPLMKCICGATWVMWDGPIITIDDGYSNTAKCPKCEREFIASIDVHIYEKLQGD